MKIALPDADGKFKHYHLSEKTISGSPLLTNSKRTIFSAAHIVANPYSNADPSKSAVIDMGATLAFRRHLDSLGLGIAEAMDTAQRGMGLDWPGTLELITNTCRELPDALIFSGAGTDQLNPDNARSLDEVRRAFIEQVEVIQKIGGRLILMASRALARLAHSPEDYIQIYSEVLGYCDQPDILHWLGDMFDPTLKDYWGSADFEECMKTVLTVIEQNVSKVDGVKISLLDKDKEIKMRRLLPQGVKMYTGDDFNYAELIQGDDEGYSHALLGIFDPLATVATQAINRLEAGDIQGYRDMLDPTVPLARLIFGPPTQYYKTGVVFLAWLNGFQDHFIMPGGAQAMRPLPYFTQVFKLADQCAVLLDPEKAVNRMRKLLAMYGA